jgi:hypothetical protein
MFGKSLIFMKFDAEHADSLRARTAGIREVECPKTCALIDLQGCPWFQTR